jgi:hypothetical protein
MLKRNMLATLVGAMLAMSACREAMAQVDASDTQRVGNLQFGNILDPTGWDPFALPDAQGMSWLHPGQLRTPSGTLYPYPYEVRGQGEAGEDDVARTDWSHFGALRLGYLSTAGDDDDMFFRRYAGWASGPVLGLVALSATNRRTGRYVEFRGSRIAGDDQYWRLRAGRAGTSRFEFFHRASPHTLSTTAYPLWDGVGTTQLALPEGVATGSTQEEVRAAMAARPRETLETTRRSTGASWEGAATRHWIGYAGVTRERREGTRPWGGPMYLGYFFGTPGPGGVGAPGIPGRYGGPYETVRPVDFTTTDIHLGLRNKGGARGWLLDFSFNGSFFRDRKDRLDFEVPFAVSPGTNAMIDGGTWALEPDNDYYSLQLEASHPLKFWNGSLSLTASWATMRQDDALQAPLDPAFCPTGASIGASGIACADWNTTAALSRTSAKARIDTMLVDARADFRPTPALGLYAHLRRYGEDNRTRYTMFNPLTGQYGYVAENGSVVLLIPEPAFSGVFDPNDPAYRSVYTQVASIPYGYDRLDYEFGGNYALGGHGTLGARYRLERRAPRVRERDRTDDQRLELDWDGKVFTRATLRVSYEAQRRSGGAYEPNPYVDAYSPSLPGYVPPAVGNTAFTVAQMSKYDLGDLAAGRLKAILIMPLGNAATLSATLHGDRKRYRAVIGRRSFDITGADAAWDWSPSPATTLAAYAGYEATRLTQANVNDKEALTYSSPDQADTAFGGPFYPFAGFWSAADDERDLNAGVHLTHAFSPRVRVDVGYDVTSSRGVNRYDAATLAAISAVYAGILDVASIGDRFPANLYRTHDLTGKLDLALSRDVELRLFCKYQRGRFFDWHLAGFDTPADLVVGNRVFTQLAPPARWDAVAVGAFITLRL